MLNLSTIDTLNLERNYSKVPNKKLLVVDGTPFANEDTIIDTADSIQYKSKDLKDAQLPLYEKSGAIVDRPWGIFGDKISIDKTYKYTHVSLFTGCGGFDLGFRQAGFKTIFANDLDSEACQTYRYNIGEIVEGDLRKIEIPKFKNRPDILSAGFPCQPFSNAGSRRGIEDDRGTLFQTAIDIVGELKPRAVVFENVRGLLSFKKDDKLLIEEICSQLDGLGYDVVFSLIDASRHNVAQKRLRVVIVGIERSPGHGRFSFPLPVDRVDLTLKHTILDLKEDAFKSKRGHATKPSSYSYR